MIKPARVNPFAVVKHSAKHRNLYSHTSYKKHFHTSSAQHGAFSNRLATASARLVYNLNRGFSFFASSAVVIAGVGILGLTAYYLSQELLVTGSDNQLFHKAFAKVDEDSKVHELLGPNLKAHGESTNQRNVKSRPLATQRFFDQYGREHVVMQFHVDGDLDTAVVKYEVIMNTQTGNYDYRYLLVDTEKHGRHYLINTDVVPKRSGGLFGIKWGKKNDDINHNN